MGKKSKYTSSTHSASLFANFKFALGVIIVVGLLSFCFQVYRGLKVDIPVLSTSKELKDAFFGGQPWLIQCIGGNVPVHELTQEAAQALVHDSSVKVAALACSERMPSGNTFWKRFGIKQRALSIDAPLLFFVANGDLPRIVEATYLQSSAALASYVLEQSPPKIHPIPNDSEFRKHCLKKKVCVVFISTGDLEQPPWLSKLVLKYRAFRMVNVDSTVHRLSFESELALSKVHTQPPGSPHIVVLRPLKGTKSGKIKGAGLTLHSENFDAPDVTAFFHLVLDKNSTHKQLQISPAPQLQPKGKRQAKKEASPTENHGKTKSGSSAKSSHQRPEPVTPKAEERQHIRYEEVLLHQQQQQQQHIEEREQEESDVEEVVEEESVIEEVGEHVENL